MTKRPNLTAEQQRELEEQFYLCHGPIKHQWEHVVASKDQRAPSFGTKVLFQCSNCTTFRHMVFSRLTGQLLARWYEYPPGYKDTPRHGADWWRMFWAEQEYVKDRDRFVDSPRPMRKPTPKQRGKRAATGNVTPIRKRKAS